MYHTDSVSIEDCDHPYPPGLTAILSAHVPPPIVSCPYSHSARGMKRRLPEKRVSSKVSNKETKKRGVVKNGLRNER